MHRLTILFSGFLCLWFCLNCDRLFSQNKKAEDLKLLKNREATDSETKTIYKREAANQRKEKTVSRDSLIHLQFIRQNISKDKEEELRKIVPNYFDGSFVKDSKSLAIYSEVIIKGKILTVPETTQFQFVTESGREVAWGSVFVDVLVTTVFKSLKVDQEGDVNVKSGDIIRAYYIEKTLGPKVRTAKTGLDYLLYQGDEAYFFLNRNILFYETPQTHEFNSLEIIPIIDNQVNYYTSANKFESKKPQELETDISKVLKIILREKSHE